MNESEERPEYAPPGCAAHEANVQAHLAEIGQVVPRGELVVQPVFGNAAEDKFQYTIGLTERGLPELAVFGFHEMTGDPLLRVAVHVLTGQGRGMMRAGRRFDLPVGSGNGPVRARLRKPFKQERDNRGPGMAVAYYQRRVPWLVMTVTGWPCPACTPCDKDALEACGCRFFCGWIYCAQPDD